MCYLSLFRPATCSKGSSLERSWPEPWCSWPSCSLQPYSSPLPCKTPKRSPLWGTPPAVTRSHHHTGLTRPAPRAPGFVAGPFGAAVASPGAQSPGRRLGSEKANSVESPRRMPARPSSGRLSASIYACDRQMSMPNSTRTQRKTEAGAAAARTCSRPV